MLMVRRVTPVGQGERLLLAAIIRRAAYDIALYRGDKTLRRKRLWRDAYQWMFSDTADHFTSFQSLCNLLDQDPGVIRRRTLELSRTDVRKYDMVDPYGRV
jgi:hypothetical protein